MKRFATIIISLFFLVNFTMAQDRLSGRSFSSRAEVISTHGMVATSYPIANQVALDVLKKGGTAVDAAIAANAFLGLAEPEMCGPGGDLFAIVWDAKQKKLFGLNASGRSPMKMTAEYFKSKNLERIPGRGPLSVSVPGCVDGWYSLHGKFGKLPMSELLQPSIQYARDGVPVTAETADWMKIVYEQQLGTDERRNFRQLIYPGGRIMSKGEVFKNPALASTYEKISNGGRDAFYKGEIAKVIASHIQKEGGFLSIEDFAKHTSEWVDPVSTNYRGYDVWELPPNGQGIAALQMLNILEGYDLSSFGFGSPEHLHYLIEAKKLAFEDLAHYAGDPAMSAIPIAKLISKDYAAMRRKLISPTRAGEFEFGTPSPEHTTYLTIADKDGNMVSLIQSVAGLFGSHEVAEGLGFVLQNRGASFDLKPGHANSYAPGKRPFHTIIPAFVTKAGKPYLSFGVLGGDMQAQGHVQVLINLIDFKMNLQEAGDAPRINHNGSWPVRGHVKGTGTTSVESGFSQETIQKLLLMGHRIQHDFGVFGGYQAIMFDGTVYWGASDPRKDGQASGY
jgi:gamma-glutamyltranspeptidase/glutathione hydrolase